MMKYDFNGKVALITGSSSGIGSEIARHFAKCGSSVVITGRNEENVSRVASECQRLSPTRIKPLEVVGDVTVEADTERLIRETIERFGRLDFLVNNAGFCQITTILDPGSLANYDKVHALDVRSMVHITLLAVPHLIKTKGNIVNISSICGLKPITGLFGYNMAKASVDMFTKSIALELGPRGVRVNSINSGGVKSNFFHAIGFNDEQVAHQEELIRRSSPLSLIGEPEDIANITLFLASNEAKYITGSTMVVDGGSLYGAIAVVDQ